MIGDKIKALLIKDDLTAKELSILANIPLTTLTDMLNGKTKNLSIQNAYKICTVLNCTLDYLVDEKVSQEAIIAIKKTPMQIGVRERKLLDIFSKLNDNGKNYIIETSEMLVKNKKYKE